MRVLLLTLAALAATAQTLEEKIEALVRQTPAIQRAYWGAHALSLGTGNVLVARNAGSYFVPASNTKLFSTALALARLPADHHMRTRLVAGAPLDAHGVLPGDLVLTGGGDPTLSGRPVPYQKSAANGDPVAAFDLLAAQAWQAGLRSVDGDIIGDDSAWVHEPYPDGWAVQDLLAEYGAPVSALSVHDNAVRVHVTPGPAPGDPARVWLTPALGFYSIDSRVSTAADSLIRADQLPGSRMLRLWGTVSLQGGTSFPVAVTDPARYAAYVMREALIRRGIAVHGGIGVRHCYALIGAGPAPTGPELASRNSPPVPELVKIVNKVSQNLHAEMLLREAARALGKAPSRGAALELLRGFLAEAGIAASDTHLQDGSGLSRLTLATPVAFTTLLRYMHSSPQAEVWLQPAHRRGRRHAQHALPRHRPFPRDRKDGFGGPCRGSVGILGSRPRRADRLLGAGE